MGRPGDVEQLREVFELLSKQGLSARRVRVGGIELELAPAPPVLRLEPEPEEAHLSPEEEERELHSLLYGASEGVDN